MDKTANEALGRPTLEQYHALPKIPLVLLLDNIRSLHNVGSVFRSSDAFLVQEICLCGITACPPHREIHKSALGATESVAWKYYDNSMDAVETFRQQGYRIVALEQSPQAIELKSFRWPQAPGLVLILGNEVDGVDSDLMAKVDQAIEIDQYGTKHSLNVSVSAGIALHHLFYQYLNR